MRPSPHMSVLAWEITGFLGFSRHRAGHPVLEEAEMLPALISWYPSTMPGSTPGQEPQGFMASVDFCLPVCPPLHCSSSGQKGFLCL